MLVCDAPGGCDSDPRTVRVVKRRGVVRDLCLWHRRHLEGSLEACLFGAPTVAVWHTATPCPPLSVTVAA